MSNALKDMPYDRFLEFAGTPESRRLSLNTGAALTLCRKGVIFTKAPLRWLGVFWCAILSIPFIYFWSDARFIAISVFLAWLGARRSKLAAVAATWREIKGNGSMPRERIAEVYGLLVRNDWLYLPGPEETTFR